MFASPSRNNSFDLNYLIPCLFGSLFANCLFFEDEILTINFLKNLIDLQFTDSSIDLHRLIRKSSCCFNIAFRCFTESVFSTRLFLTAALNEPVLQLLTQDEWYYDLDPEKMLIRFTAEDRLNRYLF